MKKPLAELRKLAREKGLKGTSSLRKNELAKMLAELDNRGQAEAEAKGPLTKRETASREEKAAKRETEPQAEPQAKRENAGQGTGVPQYYLAD